MTKTLPLKKDPATAGARFISASVLTYIIVLHSHSEAAVQCYLVEKKKITIICSVSPCARGRVVSTHSADAQADLKLNSGSTQLVHPFKKLCVGSLLHK